jgi:ATP-dependent DNA ligase
LRRRCREGARIFPGELARHRHNEKESRYRSGASRQWLKAKCEVESEFIVVGAEPNPGGAPYALLAREEPEGLVYAGAAFVTLPAEARERFWTRSEQIKIPKPVTARGLDTRKRKVSWFRPDMRVKAKHLRGGEMLRHGRLTGLVSLEG